MWKLFVNGLSERKSFGTIACRTSAASAFSTVLRDVWLSALYYAMKSKLSTVKVERNTVCNFSTQWNLGSIWPSLAVKSVNVHVREF